MATERGQGSQSATLKALLGARHNPLARNTFWMFLGQGARIPIQAAYFILIARSLGAQGYGAFVGVTALVAILAPFCGLGSGNLLVKNVSRDGSCFPNYWGKALVLTLLSGGALLAVAVLGSVLLLPATIPFPLILCVAVAELVCARLLDAASLAFQAFQRIGRVAQLSVLPTLVRLISLALLLLVTRHPSAVLWGYCYLAGNFLSALVAVLLVNRELGRPAWQRKLLLAEMREGLCFSLSISSQNVYNDIDKMVLARLAVDQRAEGIKLGRLHPGPFPALRLLCQVFPARRRGDTAGPGLCHKTPARGRGIRARRLVAALCDGSPPPLPAGAGVQRHRGRVALAVAAAANQGAAFFRRRRAERSRFSGGAEPMADGHGPR